MVGRKKSENHLSPTDQRIAAYAKYDRVELSVQRNLARAHAARVILDKLQVVSNSAFAVGFAGMAGYEFVHGDTTNGLEYLGGTVLASLLSLRSKQVLEQHEANPPEMPLYVPQEFTEQE